MLCLPHCSSDDNGGSTASGTPPPSCTPTVSPLLIARLTATRGVVNSVLTEIGYKSSGPLGMLISNSFTHEMIVYLVQSIHFSIQDYSHLGEGITTNFYLNFDNIPDSSETDEWTLEFESTSLTLKDAGDYNTGTHIYTWYATTFRVWDNDDMVDITLSAPSCE